MTDLSDPGAAFMAAANGEEPPAAPTPDAAPTPEPAAPAAPPAPAAEEGDKATDEDRGPVPWGEHKKATDEAARYRTQLRAYEDAFSAWAPEDAQVLLQAVSVAGRLAAEGRTADAASVYREIAKVLGPEAAEAVEDAVDDQADDGGDELLTKAEVERLLSERESHREYEAGVEREMREIRKAADDLGYDPQSEAWAEVLALAATFHDGDVRAAHDALKAREQAAIDRYLADKTETARKTPRVASGSNPAPASEPPKDIDDASDKLRAFLDAQ